MQGMTTNATSEYLSVKEAAAELGVSPSTIWRWIEAGRLPAQRIGPKLIRLRAVDVIGSLRAHDRPALAVPEVDPWEEVRRSIRPLTKEDGRRLDAALRRADAHREQMLKRRGGKLVPSSTDIIRQERDNRSRES